jgi:hypothetical protein
MLRKISSTGIILLFTITIISASGIDGIWQVSKSNDYIEIRKTNDGIKAKFVDARDWDFYEHLRRNTYEDRKGNRYIFNSSDKLVWESRDGRRSFQLRKANNDYGYVNNRRNRSYNSGYDSYENNRNNKGQQRGRYDDGYDYNRNYKNNRGNYNDQYCNSGCAANCKIHKRGKFRGKDRHLVHQLSGTWHNRWRNTVAYVEYDGFALRMKTNRSRKWTTFRRTHHRKLVFEDKWGNRLKFKNNGELEWKRADGRRDIDFVKRYY